MPAIAGSQVTITYHGTAAEGGTQDITSHVMPNGTTLSSQANAVPGQATFRLKDTARALSFTTGREITCDIDDYRLWGGYVMQVDRDNLVEAADTRSIATYKFRSFSLRCSDYNILLDKRVLRDDSNPPTSYLGLLPTQPDGSLAGALMHDLLASYIDVPAGFDITSLMTNTTPIPGGAASASSPSVVRYNQQGSFLRKQFEMFNQFAVGVWYINPDRKFVFTDLEDNVNRWAFSDVPDRNVLATGAPPTITDPDSLPYIPTYPFREVRVIEDGTPITNDAIVWGGSPLAGSGQLLYFRAENTASENLHNRWQTGEVHSPDDPPGGFGQQTGVTARAQAIVDGPPGADALGRLKGLQYSQWQISATWFAHDVPYYNPTNERQHIRPGSIQLINMEVHGIHKPLVCRRLDISFPALQADGSAIVRFDGDFALNMDDPVKMWAFLLQQTKPTTASTAVVPPGSTTTTYGAYGKAVPTPDPDGIETVFFIPFGYIPNQINVYLNGLIQRKDEDYVESDNVAGEFTMSEPPASDDTLYCTFRTLAT